MLFQHFRFWTPPIRADVPMGTHTPPMRTHWHASGCHLTRMRHTQAREWCRGWMMAASCAPMGAHPLKTSARCASMGANLAAV